jgi:hypothetical protein
VSKIDLAYVPAPGGGHWNGVQLFRLVVRALLRALRDSRGRAAKKIIHDYRHLLPEQAGANSSHDDARK